MPESQNRGMFGNKNSCSCQVDFIVNQICCFASTMKKKRIRKFPVACHSHPTEKVFFLDIYLRFITTVFIDTRLWKTKHLRKRFQNFRQSCVLLTDRIEIHQLQPLPGCDLLTLLRHAIGL